ncbi:carboxypeptidase regulatory-like domain-containing protein [Spirosoma sp. BT704]|uniref:Carboxypeptidase regulatory-like domain-containing protein n=2 Tax=Spirosoma validum TaxID=2771355 RepID=A0A927GHF1_9BACT|nr:carboxypeptidase regulatory-like domain-containing protein [Spirosoma validum]
MKPMAPFLLATCLIYLVACSKPTGESISPDPNTPQAGYVSGKVVDAQNRPINGAEITINNTGEVVNNLIGYSDANGNYKIKLSTGGGPLIGSYYVRGHVTINYLNYPFKLALFVEDDRAFAPEEGAVKNLKLMVAGPRSNVGDSGWYGGTIEVDNHTRNAHFPNIEVTLEPVGPLVDGSNGQTQIARPDWLYSYNIPVGQYKITARDIATNKSLAVKNYYYDKSYQASTMGVFEPILTGSDRYRLVIDVTDL